MIKILVLKPFLQKIIWIALCFVLSCSFNKTKEDQAKALVQEYLKDNLHDNRSYEPVGFGKVDTVLTTVYDEPYYQNLTKQFDSFFDVAKPIMEEIQSYQPITTKYEYDKVKSLLPKLKDVKIVMDSLTIEEARYKENYERRFMGYYITHKYRSKNTLGATVLNNDTFYIDSTLTKIASN